MSEWQPKYQIYGVDVSKWQASQDGKQLWDYNKARQAGARFAFVRAGSIDNVTGQCYEDYQWQHNRQAIDIMPIGAYWYFRPNHDPYKQADYFSELCAPLIGGHVYPFFAHIGDNEADGGLNPTDASTRIAKFFQRIGENLPEIKRINYTRAAWWNASVREHSLWRTLDLWIALYNEQISHPWNGLIPLYKPRDWDNWQFWQFSADGNGRGAEFGAASRSIDINYFNGTEAEFLEYVGMTDEPGEEPPVEQPPEYTEVWSGAGVHIDLLHEVFPEMKHPYYEAGVFDPATYAEQVQAFIDKQVEAGITHVYVKAFVGAVPTNQHRISAYEYANTALPVLIEKAHAAELSVVAVQEFVYGNDVVYGSALEQALAVMGGVPEMGFDGVLLWVPDNLPMAAMNMLNSWGAFVSGAITGPPGSPGTLMLPRGISAPAILSDYPNLPVKVLLTGPPKFATPDGWVTEYKYINAMFQAFRVNADQPAGDILQGIDEYIAGLWVDDPTDPTCKDPAAIWPVLMTDGATAEALGKFEAGVDRMKARSWSFYHVAQFSPEIIEELYDEEPQEPPVEPPVEPPPATNPPDEVLFVVKIKGLPSGVTLRLRSTPGVSVPVDATTCAWTANDKRFAVVDVAQDKNGKDWYCIGVKGAPESLWVASWYTAKV